MLLYTSQRKAVGIGLMSGVGTSSLEAWICTRCESTEGMAAGQAVMGTIIGIVGGGFFY